MPQGPLKTDDEVMNFGIDLIPGISFKDIEGPKYLILICESFYVTSLSQLNHILTSSNYKYHRLGTA